jgi:thioesterase domain-containing protein
VHTVEEVADRFIASIRGVQPEGPYLVGGHCCGGIVTFEIARRFTAQGQSPPQTCSEFAGNADRIG